MIKYPRTPHFQFSPEVHSDDKVISLKYLGHFLSTRVIISEKIDGGCTDLSEDVFARSHSTPTDCETFDYIKNVHFHSKRHLFNKDYSYYGENTYAIHSIKYEDLDDSFYLFHVLDRVRNVFLSWDDVLKESKRIGFQVVPIVYDGEVDNMAFVNKFMDKEIKKESKYGSVREGFVMRVAGEIPFEDFGEYVGKYVRKGHVQSDKHWKVNWKPQPRFNKS